MLPAGFGVDDTQSGEPMCSEGSPLALPRELWAQLCRQPVSDPRFQPGFLNGPGLSVTPLASAIPGFCLDMPPTPSGPRSGTGVWSLVHPL